jgi:hypothetical protein
MSSYSRVTVANSGEYRAAAAYEATVAGVDAELTKVAAALVGSSQAMTVSGAITPGVNYVSLNHTSTKIAATIADATAHAGVFVIDTISEPAGGQDHTVTISGTGSFNGTNKVATFADTGDKLVVFFNAAGRGTVLENTGSVALS